MYTKMRKHADTICPLDIFLNNLLKIYLYIKKSCILKGESTVTVKDNHILDLTGGEK